MSANGPITQDNTIQQAFGSATPKIHFNLDVFKQLLTQWIVEFNISFHQVENPSFRLLPSYLAAMNSSYTAVPRSLPRSSNTVRAWILHTYKQHKHSLIQQLMDINSVHFSFDLWSSPNHMALLGLTAHWIGVKSDTYHVLLGLRHLYGAHTGENQAQVVLTLLQEYELCQKVGYFTLDNAE